MKFTFGCALAYRLPAPTPFVFNIEAAGCGGQHLREQELVLTPDVAVERWTMPESGNRYLRVTAGPGEFRLEYTGVAMLQPHLEDPGAVVQVPSGQLPFEVYTHLYPSRYCQSDRLERFARNTFSEAPTGYHRVNAVCNWIRDHVEYASGTSDASTSALDILVQRAGVCRDFAHLAIASAAPWAFPPVTSAPTHGGSTHPISTLRWRLGSKGRKEVPGICSTRRACRRRKGSCASASAATRQRWRSARPFGAFEAEVPRVWINGPEDADAPSTTQAVRYAD